MEIGALLSEYGIWGIITFVLGSGLIYLFKENRSLIKQLFDVQEQRRLETLATAKELFTTLQSFEKGTSLLIDKIQVSRGDKS